MFAIKLYKYPIKVYLLTILLFICPFSFTKTNNIEILQTYIQSRYKDKVPLLWGEHIPGIKTKLDTNQKVIALSLDACGSPHDNYDSDLIDYLIKNKIPATLFINSRWITKYKEIFLMLANTSLFEIENHGTFHKPCSVAGRSVYGIKGTESPSEIVSEIEINSEMLSEYTGHNPKFYRSGTAYYDDVALDIVHSLGYEAIGFSILGDAGSTYSKEQVKEALVKASAGDIVILHMNHKESETAEGVMEAIPVLLKNGYKFVKLEDFLLR
ncbi:MAG: polysaccharide deacetylase family protein [Candidatus Margulisbacteria bacterium]|nr:polysaccharide deacetylase family protein [Candidatus Margulisiibacteriota bacterium]